MYENTPSLNFFSHPDFDTNITPQFATQGSTWELPYIDLDLKLHPSSVMAAINVTMVQLLSVFGV